MKTLIAALGPKKVGFVPALLTAGAVGGWAISTAFATMPPAAEVSAFEAMRKNDMRDPQELKRSLIGSYVVTGTDPDGTAYAGAHILNIALAPSGGLELEWDRGRNVGVGQVIGNVLAVATWAKGRTVILVMNINQDGSLSGQLLRRTDRGAKGGETWRRVQL